MDMRGCAATPRRPSGHRQKQNGYRASQRRREMATKPSPSWPPFPIPNFGLIVKLRGNRSFLSSKTFNDRLFPPPPSPSSPLLSSLEIEPNFRIVASVRFYLSKKIFQRETTPRCEECHDRGEYEFSSFLFFLSFVRVNRCEETKRTRIRFSNRAGSYRSSPPPLPFNYAFDGWKTKAGGRLPRGARSAGTNTGTTDSHSIRSVNLSKALASPRHE